MNHGARFTSSTLECEPATHCVLRFASAGSKGSIPIVVAMLLSLAALFFTATSATAQGSAPQISITPTTLTAGQPTTSQTPVLNTTSIDSSNTWVTTPLNQPGSVLLF